MILGIDEVGRGSWAGPLVVGAVVLGGKNIEGLTDSKLLSRKRREELDHLIRSNAKGLGLGWVSAGEIDEIGLAESLKLASKRAVEQIDVFYDEIIIDGTVNFLEGTTKARYVKTMKKGDLLVPSVSAASIIAKVARDSYMSEQDIIYTGYDFKSHVGYGTSMHSKAIEKLGVTPQHRLSFAPLQRYSKTYYNTKSPAKGSTLSGNVRRNTKELGDKAEGVAANYLLESGHEILERNWKTKFCEIDIVSAKADTVYFTEVKYRKNSQQGGGIAAITPKKLKQMKFASGLYALNKHLFDSDFRLLAISVTGRPPKFESCLEVD